MSADGFLHRYFINHNGNLISKWLHYFDIYELHFSRFRGTDVRFLEIGVGQGGSQQMWREYFGADASILCMDIRDFSDRVNPAFSKFYQGDQTDAAALQRILDENGPLDIVLDDGSHMSRHIIGTFEYLYPRMSPSGVYMVEDVQCVYKPHYQGGLKAPGSFMEYAKDLLDHVNFAYIPEFPNDDEFGCSTHSVNFYDSIVAFERRPKAHVQWALTGKQGVLGDKPWIPRPPDRVGSKRRAES